jgi:hypothetical protein
LLAASFLETGFEFSSVGGLDQFELIALVGHSSDYRLCARG